MPAWQSVAAKIAEGGDPVRAAILEFVARHSGKKAED
jgi:hypothetical protein